MMTKKTVSVVAISDELGSADISPELKERLAGVQKRIHGIITADDTDIPDAHGIFNRREYFSMWGDAYACRVFIIYSMDFRYMFF